MIKKLGCFGWVLALGLFVALAFAGGLLLFSGLEVLALAFTRLGVDDPTLAWGLTGLGLGTLVGAIVGLRRAGRKGQFVEIALAVLLVSGLAVLGASAAGGYVRFEPRSSVLFDVVITTEELNVRPAPSLGNDPVTTVSQGQRLGVVDTAPGWYAVRFERDGRAYEGWISSTYASRTDSPPTNDENRTKPLLPVPETGRSVPLRPSASVPVRTSQGRLDAQVLGGSAVSVPGVDDTRVALRMQEYSYNLAGVWPPWSDAARASYLTDSRGTTYQASVTESVGPGGDVLPGRVREGTLVIYVPLPPEDVAALTLVYASGDAPPVRLSLDGPGTRP